MSPARRAILDSLTALTIRDDDDAKMEQDAKWAERLDPVYAAAVREAIMKRKAAAPPDGV